MQQPLAHLYFLTVLEHLMSKDHSLVSMVRLANYILEQCDSSECCDNDKIILWIELQSVVQVIAQTVPHYLGYSEAKHVIEKKGLQVDINRYITIMRTPLGYAMHVTEQA